MKKKPVRKESDGDNRPREYTLPAELVEEFAHGNGVLWLGAGCSMKSGLPSWTSLIRSMGQHLIKAELCESFDIEHSLNLLETAQMFRTAVGERYFYDFMRTKINARNSATLPDSENITLDAVARCINHFWPDPGLVAVSTNYDSLLEERLLRVHGKRSRTVVSREDVATVDFRKDLTLLKPNGDISQPVSIVLTLGDYCTFRDKKNWMVPMLADLAARKTILFVGYSLNDFTVNSILGEIQSQLRGFGRRAYLLTTDYSTALANVHRSLGVESIRIATYDEIPNILDAIVHRDQSVETAIGRFQLLDTNIVALLQTCKAIWIDDDALMLNTHRKIFARVGLAHWEMMPDPHRALKLVKRRAYDFIITDIAMAVSGFDVVRAARQSVANRRAVICTWSGYAEVGKSFTYGADAAFSKLEELTEMLQQLAFMKRLRDGSYTASLRKRVRRKSP